MYREKNLQFLNNNRNIVDLNNIDAEDNNQFDFISTKNNELTCHFNKSYWIHSRFNAKKEAERFISSHLEILDLNMYQEMVIYGFGCGHHIREILIKTPSNVKINIWESNNAFFNEVINYGDFSDIFNNERVILTVTQKIEHFKRHIELLDLSKTYFIIHKPSLQMIPKKLVSLKDVLDNYNININTIKSGSTLLKQNFLFNTRFRLPGITSFINQFVEIPVVMVSAGPSLLKNIHLLKQVKDIALLCCVGTALKPLINSNITPDFFMITDPTDLVVEQIDGLENLQIPFFMLSTACFKLNEIYNGPKFIVYQNGFEDAENYAKNEGVPTIETGGSVATSLFSLLNLFGFNPICLIGQDLAYTNNETHVIGSHNYKKFEHINEEQKVLGFNQTDYVATSKNLKVYLSWFEKEAAKLSGKELYNATEGGAYIHGFEHIKLNEFINLKSGINSKAARLRFENIVKTLIVNPYSH